MSCETGIKYLLNEYEYYSHNQEPKTVGSVPIGTNCTFLTLNPGQNHNIQYFLGTDYENLETPDTVALFGIRDLMIQGGLTTISVGAADNPTFTLNYEVFDMDVSPSDLVGLTNDDILIEFDAFVTKKPYWFVRVFTENVVFIPIRKIMLGRALKLNRNPTLPVVYIIDTQTIEAVRNNINFILNYSAISNESKLDLLERLLKNLDFIQGAIIDSENQLLFNKKMMMIRLAESNISLRSSKNGYDLNMVIEGLL